MRTKNEFLRCLSILITLLFLMEVPLYADPQPGDMKYYCVIPPYVKRDVQPNILIMMDNAQVMGEAAYTDTYDPSKTYNGLFQSDLMYTYGSNSWTPDAAGIYKGNLLNWATTSKYDLLQNILLGGKSASRQTNINTLQSISTSWTKTLTYTDSTGTTRVCKFIVSSANVEIKDNTAGSCGYLDSPAHPLVASNESAVKFAAGSCGSKQPELNTSDSIFRNIAKETFGFFSEIMDFLIPDAEAAANLKLPSGDPPSGTECTAYSGTLTASGGTGTGYTWSITSGSLPAGLTLTSGTPSATISGTPTVASGTYTFTLQVCDDAGCVNKHMDSKSYNLVINDATVTITTTSPMAGGTVSSWYRAPICASGPCTGTTTWTQTAGTLPPVLSLGVSTAGANCTDLNGTPTVAGTYNFTVRVTDSKSNTATQSFSVTILPSAGSFQISTASPLTAATNGVSYLADIATSGFTCAQCCTCGWTWSMTSGSLPSGLLFNSGGPCISGDHVYVTGTPTSTGTFSFTVQVTAPALCGGGTATKTFSITVNAAPVTIRTTGNRNVKVCAGNYSLNCDNAPHSNTGPPCSASYPDDCVLKSGIIDQFWPQARFGLEDFNKQAGNAVPDIPKCIVDAPGTAPDSDFCAAVENAVPIDPTTTLVDGEYSAVDYYANDNSHNCDPFRNSQSCQKNFVLTISSGVGADNPPNPSGGSPLVWSDSTKCGSSAYKNLSKNTCFGYMNDLRNAPTFGANNLPGKQYTSTYIVNTMGTPTTQGNGHCDPTATPLTTGDILCQAANAGGGSYYEVVDPTTLKQSLIQAFQDILKRAAAGTAASVLASGEGSGANLIQAVFYPRTQKIQAGGIFDTEINWIGRLTNFWFYVDPFFNASSIYEDNASTGTFDLSNDNRVTFFYDTSVERTMAHRYPPTGTLPDVAFEKLNSLWEAGVKLWQRDLSANPRTIYIPGSVTGVASASNLDYFSTGNASAISPYLALSTVDTKGSGFADGDLNRDGSVDAADASVLMNYVKGLDYPSYTWMRSRTVGVDLNNNNNTSDSGEEPKVWKLGDVLNSTPRISSWIALNNYDQVYKDGSYTNYINSAGYRSRGTLFAGSNDGMLHAFKLGRLTLTWSGQTSNQKAKLVDPSTGTVCQSTDPTSCGAEMWAYIPKNVLPYLKYLANPDYCHIYSIDLSPYIFDASIGNTASGDISTSTKPSDGSTWRTILVGGMRFGGACKNSCPDSDCVQNPTSGLGYSSYFALDVTDQANPTLLWEFSNEDLGLTTTGPAVVRIGDPANNGKWFVVFGSGPTGPISTSDQQFLAHSDQNMRLFILDLKTGTLSRTIDTGIQNAFAGSMLNATSDVDQNYQDDVVYIGYVKKTTLGGTWTQGGVGRLQTKQNPDPSNWSWSQVIDNIGPMTSSVTRLINKNKGQLWIFFGTGRYYYEQTTSVDDGDSRRNLYGLKDPCYSLSGLDANCTTTFSGSLTDVTSTPNADPNTITNGWVISLDPSGTYAYNEGNPPSPVTRNYRAERVITDPLATSSGLIFFTSYKPYDDVCAYGGKSFIWALRYNSGSAPGALLKGIALLQVSTGSIEQVNLSSAFTEMGGRRTSALEGVPPVQQGLSLLSTPPPVKRTLHIRER